MINFLQKRGWQPRIKLVASLVLLLLSVLAVANLLRVSAENEKLRRRVTTLAETYFQERADRITVNGVRHPNLTTIPLTERMAARLRYEGSELDRQRAEHRDRVRRVTLDDSGYSKAEVSITVKDFKVGGPEVALTVEEHARLFFVPSHPDAPPAEEYALPHTLRFILDKGGWKLADLTTADYGSYTLTPTQVRNSESVPSAPGQP